MRRRRAGFTLVEVMLALVILSVVVLGVGATTARFLQVVTTSERSSAALQLVNDRLELVRLHPDYSTLDSTFAGEEAGFPSLPDLRRVTQVVRFGGTGQATDFKRVTVTVSGPGLLAPVARTVTVAAP